MRSHLRSGGLARQSLARQNRWPLAVFGGVTLAVTMTASSPASAKTCKELRALCYTMRDDKSDCTRPYRRCLETGTFITPLGRVFKATK